MNPTLQGMKKMIEAKEKAYDLAKREYYPDFNFRFAYGQRDNTPGTEQNRRDMLTGMMEVNIPIYYKSKQDRKVAEVKADIQNLEAQYRAMKNEILFMIAEIGSMIQREERKIELYKTGIIPQTSLQINSAMSAYRVNKADFMTLLDSQMTLFKYELEYHLSLTEYEKNTAGLGAASWKTFLSKGGRKMKRLTWIVLVLVLSWLILGCGKGKETAAPKEEMKHEEKKGEVAKKATDLEMEMKGMTMEAIQKEGKVTRGRPRDRTDLTGKAAIDRSEIRNGGDEASREGDPDRGEGRL